MARKRTPGQGPTNYAVGRGKPPQHTRFQPGQSGNPGGRKKESLNRRTILERVLNKKIQSNDQAERPEMTVFEALLWTCAQSGLNKNQRALEFMVNQAILLESQNHVQSDELEQDDQALLDAALLARFGSGRTTAVSKGRTCSNNDDHDDDEDDAGEADGSDNSNRDGPPGESQQKRRRAQQIRKPRRGGRS